MFETADGVKTVRLLGEKARRPSQNEPSTPHRGLRLTSYLPYGQSVERIRSFRRRLLGGKPSMETRNLKLGHHLVAFLDVLGQSERFKKLRLPATSEEHAEVGEVLRQTAGFVLDAYSDEGDQDSELIVISVPGLM